MGFRPAALSVLALAATACSLLTDLSGFGPSAASITLPGEEGVVDGAAATDGGQTDGGHADGNMPTDPYGRAVASDAPVAWFRFEETSGITAKDIGSTPQDGTFSPAGITLAVPGIGGSKALRLDGQQGRVQLGHRLSFVSNTPFTLELWFRSNGADDSVRFLLVNADPSDSSRNWQISYRDAFVQFERVGPVVSNYLSLTQGPTEGAWMHIVVTYSGLAAILYINGVQVNVSGISSGVKTDPPNSELSVGDLPAGNSAKTRGDLDEIAIYDKVLSPLQIKAHFDAAQ